MAMDWRKRDLWKAGIVVGGVLFLVFMALMIVSVADAREGLSGAATPTPATVQATPPSGAIFQISKRPVLLEQ